MPRTPEVCSRALTPFSQFSNGLQGRLNVLPLRRLNAAFSRRIFFGRNEKRFFRRSLTAACLLILLITYHASLIPTYGQSATATLSGTVIDQNNAVVTNVSIAVINIAQGFQRSATTNDEGIFVVPLLPPGSYIVKAEREGFTPAEVRDVVLNVNDQRHLKIPLKVGGVDQTVDIVDTSPLINESPTVGTIVDRQFVGNLPLNGRSFQSLITLTPGVVLTKTNSAEPGQFSVNGQRANANNFIVDGVSANIGTAVTSFPGQFGSGSLPGLTASGGTNNLVSVDALQEFKVLTSTFAPEFGRMPGAQISIITRSGTNDFHGAIFDYLRNDKFDANDWFANANRLGKAALRQNDFGGVLGGPILLPRFGEGGRLLGYDGRNRTFFFFSYEGLRLRLPQTGISQVPSLAARQVATAQIKPFVDAFPLPNGTDLGNGFARFTATYSDPSTLDATSIRVDHTVNQKISLFGRYNYAPSEAVTRGAPRSLNTLNHRTIKTQTITVGTTLLFGDTISNDLRINYSRNEGNSFDRLDNFGGAKVPADSIFFPSGGSIENARLTIAIVGGDKTSFNVGKGATTVQRQFNIVNGLSILSHNHQIKIGGDYRRLSPILDNLGYEQIINFNGVGNPASPAISSLLSGRIRSGSVISRKSSLNPIFDNLSLYAQDAWKISPKMILTYGLRWEYVPPPHDSNGNEAVTLTGLDGGNPSIVISDGGPLWETTYNNFAPRIGLSYVLSQTAGRESVLRGGFGVFYDLGEGPVANAFASSFPFVSLKRLAANARYPLTAADAAPPVVGPMPASGDFLFVFDPNLKLPRVYQWNVAVEQSLGSNQTVSASYVAAIGRDLLRLEKLGQVTPPTAALDQSFLIRNSATSDYHAMQLQFQRRLSQGLQALMSYTWSHSIDVASSDSTGIQPGSINKTDPKLDRGPSSFDVRHAFTGALSYNIPAPNTGVVGNAFLRNWAIDSILTARSATPVDVIYTVFSSFGFASLRPDLIAGQQLYLTDPNVAGGRRINPLAFTVPATERQGTLGRNSLRGFSAWQLDFALRRQFNLTERLNLQLRAEAFNIFNHPNFGDPDPGLGTLFGGTLFRSATFGRSASMLGRSLGSSTSGLNPLYQIGGPRSLQLSLKLQF